MQNSLRYKMPDTRNSGKIMLTGKKEKEDLLCQIV